MDNTPIIEKYADIDAIIDATKSREPLPDIWSVTVTDEKVKDRRDFYGVDKIEDAYTLLKNGYDKAVDELKTSIKANRIEDKSRAAFSSSITGAAPVVPNAIIGLPNSMLSRRVEPPRDKVITLLIDVTYSWIYTEDQVFEYGKNVVKHVKELERDGYRVNIKAIYYIEQSPHDECVTFTLKRADRPLDIKRLSFAVMHTAFMRVILFQWYERVPGGSVKANRGGALACTGDQKYCENKLKKHGLLDKNTYYINICSDIARVLNK